MEAKEYFEKTHPLNIGVVTNEDCIKTMEDYLKHCLAKLIKSNQVGVVETMVSERCKRCNCFGCICDVIDGIYAAIAYNYCICVPFE